MIQIVVNILQVGILLLSVSIHEAFHGLAAFWMGDPTAKYKGRLTLNPIKHLDPIGSIAVPLLTMLLPGPVFGWAKPVPINPYNFSDRRKGEILTSLAGPLSNLVVGVISGFALRFVSNGLLVYPFLQYMSIINIFLAIFNLVPVPPLDGSHILINIWPGNRERIRMIFRQYGTLFMIFFFMAGVGWITPLAYNLFRIVSGSSLLY